MTDMHVVDGWVAEICLQQTHPSTRQEWPLQGDCVTIGREAQADVCLADQSVSRHHAVIERHGASFVIVDRGSANGTFVNGSRVRRQALRIGDRIVVGDSELLVAGVEEPTGPTPAFTQRGATVIGSQSGNRNNVVGTQNNYIKQGSLDYIASRRGFARRLIVGGVVAFFAGQALGVTGVLIFQHQIFDLIDSSSATSSPQFHIPASFFPLAAVGVLLSLLGLALFVFGLITRVGAKRQAERAGVPW